jgi:hypothetical protein
MVLFRRMRALVSALLLGFCATAVRAQDAGAQWQLVLLKPRECISCVYAEELLKRRGFLQTAELLAPGAPPISARIVRRNSSELTAAESQELAALPYIDLKRWAAEAALRSTQVLLKRDGRVVSAGNIADSADLRRAEFPESVMAPRDSEDPLALRSEHDGAYVQMFLRRWNLDWFYELAVNPRLLETRSMDNYIAAQPAPGAPPPGPRNVVLLSTATWPGNNEIFNATRIEEIRAAALRDLGVDAARISVLYGGANPNAANAVEVRQGRLAFARHPIEGARPATLPGLTELFKRLNREGGSRNLFVLVGHGGPDGAGLWGQAGGLSPTDLAALHQHGKGDDVLVSGNCFGGVMARAMSCGFFAARPDIIATGCQADAAEVAQSRDYLKMFFASLDPAERNRADANHDGQISFEEAHWYASVTGDTRNVTYTTLDALADAWFTAHPDTLPASLKVADVRQLAARAPAVEQQAIARMTDGLTPDVDFSLTDLAVQATAWSQLQSGVRPMIAQLARRMLYVQRHAAAEPAVAQVRACEARPIAQFLAP